MPSDRGGLLGPLFASSRADQELTDRAFLQAMLDAERALAEAGRQAGIVPDRAAAAIAGACRADRFDPDDLGRRAVAAADGDGLRFDIRLQGDQETPFLAI